MQFFKSRRRLVLIIGVACIAILSGMLLISDLTKKESTMELGNNTVQANGYNTATLLKFKTSYVGDNSNVVNLLGSLPFANMRREVSLKTDHQAYAISVKYDFSASSISLETIEDTLRKNAIIMFALIDNVDEINFNFVYGADRGYTFPRAQLQLSFVEDLRDYARDIKSFETLLNIFSLKLIAFPEKYSLAMSSTPGIRISTQYNGAADMVEYSTIFGRLFTWDNASGKISEYSQNVKLPLSTPVYWSPSTEGKDQGENQFAVKAIILNKHVRLAEKTVLINFDRSTYFYTVVPSYDVIIAENAKPQSQNPKSIDEAVSLAIKSQSKGYGPGELSTEGHLILDTEEKDGKIKVYTIVSFGAYGFENGIFTMVSGSGAISTVMTFSKNEKGEYSLLEYREPMDGAGNLQSKKEMFPQRLWDKVLAEHKQYPELAKQKEEQAKHYLQSIGRNAKVSDAHVDKKLPNINVEASNKLFAKITKEGDPELNKFPYWIGTKELIENGVRCIYETSQNKSSDGYDLISFKKIKEDGIVIKEFQYKIVGNEPKLIGPN